MSVEFIILWVSVIHYNLDSNWTGSTNRGLLYFWDPWPLRYAELISWPQFETLPIFFNASNWGRNEVYVISPSWPRERERRRRRRGAQQWRRAAAADVARNYHAIWRRPLITSPFHQRAARPRLGRGHERLSDVAPVAYPRARGGRVHLQAGHRHHSLSSALPDGRRRRFPEGNQFRTVTGGVMTGINVRSRLSARDDGGSRPETGWSESKTSSDRSAELG